MNLIIGVRIAYCYPFFFHYLVNHIIGEAHAGWRGTVGKIAQTTLNAMISLGADVTKTRVAIGQGICQQNFEVGDEVIEQFEKAGFPSTSWKNNRIDLTLCNQHVLKESGIATENTWIMNRCSFEPEFFSYRRDKGKTGRMWAVIAMN
jgi:polyphenol oxidase